MPEPLVSVVVSTKDRPQGLERLLAGLRAQTVPSGSFEVIVVDDGSGPATQAVLSREAAAGGLQLRTVRHRQARGPGRGRNSGWRLARASLVGFTDDDCVPAPDWLAAALRAAKAAPGTIIQGRTQPEAAERDSGSLLSRTVRVTSLGPQYETCNIFYPRAILESLGGFDEDFGLRPGGEDTDLAWRALERGSDASFAEQALVFHAVERLGILGTLRDATRWTASVRLFAEHRGTRQMLHRGIFWNVWHYLLARSALSLLGPRWLRWLVLSRHADQLRRRGSNAGAGAWSVPFLLVHDLIEAGAIIRGAIRYRTLVL